MNNNLLPYLLCTLILTSCMKQKQIISKFDNKQVPTNSFFDNLEIYSLQLGKFYIDGEVIQPGYVNYEKLQKRSIIVKETVLDTNNNPIFIGAFKYEGYSLSDILDPFLVHKKNADEFPPFTDLYVEIKNDYGHKVIISWGEIYYPNILHQIIIATDVMRIIPEKTNELWTLPSESKLIVGTDILSVRNISNPNKITIKSAENTIQIQKGLQPLYAPTFSLYDNDQHAIEFHSLPDTPQTTVHTVFYGKGRGLHSLQPYTGNNIKDIFIQYIQPTNETIQKGLFHVTSIDGYNAVFSYSELCNRNDQAHTLLLHVHKEDAEKSSFRLYPSSDFFSDRAVKAISVIRFELIN